MVMAVTMGVGILAIMEGLMEGMAEVGEEVEVDAEAEEDAEAEVDAEAEEIIEAEVGVKDLKVVEVGKVLHITISKTMEVNIIKEM
jgi:hypothetical protein